MMPTCPPSSAEPVLLSADATLRLMATLVLVPLLLATLRSLGVVKGLGLTEILTIGLLVHAPTLLVPEVGSTFSVILNIVLIMRVQEVQAAAGVAVAVTSGHGAATAETQRPAESVESSSREPDTLPPAPLAPPKLSTAEAAQVDAGEMVLKTIVVPTGNEGLAVQRVNAPADVVWATILDFPEWPRMVDDVVASHVYDRSGSSIKVAITIGVAGGFLSIKTFVHHIYDRAAGTLTWSLDQTKVRVCFPH